MFFSIIIVTNHKEFKASGRTSKSIFIWNYQTFNDKQIKYLVVS